MFLLNNILFDIHIQHTISDVQYPAGWFRDAAERAKIGVVEVADIPRPDDRFNVVIANPDGTWTLTPRSPEDLARIDAEEKASTVASLVAQTQAYLDSKAVYKGYDDASSCVSYLNSSNQVWKGEAAQMNIWRDEVWLACYTNVANVTPTTTWDDLLMLLPVAPW